MKDYIKLYDLHGGLAAVLENAYNVVVDEKLGGAETLEFSMPFEDVKTQYVKHDEEVVYSGKRYIVTQIVDGRDENGIETIDVSCELAYIELLNTTKQGDFLIDRKSIADGLRQILNGTRWQIGMIEKATGDIYSMRESNKTVLFLVRQWANVVGLEIQWDSVSRKVNLLQRIGSDRGAGFRYKKNLKSIKRTVKPPEATVLYPYGRNGLSISDFNNGREYLEDYSWYTSQGLTLAEAKQKYKKEYIWQDDRFILTSNLLDAAKKKLEELSQPIISYECSVLDLSSITGLGENTFYIGDTVRVYDSDLGIDVNTRILHLKRYPQEPWKNEVELSYITPGLQDTEERSISSEVAELQPSMLFATNNDQLVITTTPQFPASIAITNFSATNAQIGLMIIGQASAVLTVTVKLFLAGVQITPTIQQICQAGYNTIGVPFVLAQLQPGAAFLDVQVSTNTGTFTVAANHFQFYIYAANLLGGTSPEAPRVIWEEPISVSAIDSIEVIANVQIPTAVSLEENITAWQITTSAIVTLA